MRFPLAVLIALIAAWPVRAEVPGFAACAYTIELLDPRAERLRITVECRGDGPFELRGWRSMPNDHVREATALDGSKIERDGRVWRLTGTGGTSRARYDFDMLDLTGSTNSFALGRYVGGSLVTSVTSFLLVPPLPDATFALRFRAPEGARVASAFARRGGWHRFKGGDFPRTGYLVMGRFARRAIELPGRGSLAPAGRRPRDIAETARLELIVLDAPMEPELDELTAWIRRIAMETARYWQGFPVDRALLVVNPVQDGGGLFRGHVLSGGGATVLLHVGRYSEIDKLMRHWMLTHELAHLGNPDIAGGHRWFSEGMAVYVDALVRARAGLVDPRAVWKGWYGNLPKGEQAMEGAGLAAARTIRDVYWGGALFMMLADVEIRRRTENGYSLDDCLRGVLWAGGDTTAHWPLQRIANECDAATGVPVMRQLLDRHLDSGGAVDLPALWRSLGVAVRDGRATFDETAPLAYIRRSQTAPDGR